MTSVQNHIQLIERNEEFLKDLLKQKKYPEWAVVATFYIAVHYSRALLAHAHVQVISHVAAEASFLKEFGDRKCYEHIEILKNQSEKARYSKSNFSWRDVDGLIKNRLEPFKSCVRQLARQQGLTIQ